jgi:hypothetical protein
LNGQDAKAAKKKEFEQEETEGTESESDLRGHSPISDPDLRI